LAGVVHCEHCGNEIAIELAEECKVTPIEAREFRGSVREGEIVCAVCWHEIKWAINRPAQNDDDLEDWGINIDGSLDG
jgi:hypothetical protein